MSACRACGETLVYDGTTHICRPGSGRQPARTIRTVSDLLAHVTAERDGALAAASDLRERLNAAELGEVDLRARLAAVEAEAAAGRDLRAALVGPYSAAFYEVDGDVVDAYDAAVAVGFRGPADIRSGILAALAIPAPAGEAEAGEGVRDA